MKLEKELKIAEIAARKAGEIALAFVNDGNVDFKKDNEGPVTQADRDADLAIRKIIKSEFPQDSFITEESFQKNDPIPDSGRVWFIDPIDGTSYFIKDDSDYVVMIGLVIDKEPVLGIVFQPKTGLLWRAVDSRALVGKDAVTFTERLDGDLKPVKIEITNRNFSKSSPTAVISKKHSHRFIDFLNTELNVLNCVKKGSIGLKLALIAEGTADFYITSSKRIKLWDTCAPFVVLTAAGGFVTDINGHKLKFYGQIAHGIEICAATPSGKKWLDLNLPNAIKRWQTAN